MTSRNRFSVLYLGLVFIIASGVSPSPKAVNSGQVMGAELTSTGVVFRVWAPHATSVHVKGDSSSWSETSLTAEAAAGGESGIWSGEVVGARAGDHYIYKMTSDTTDAAGLATIETIETIEKIDPASRQIDGQWSLVSDPSAYVWKGEPFTRPPLNQAIIYELHVGSFNVQPGQTWGGFRSVAARLEDLSRLGVNYIEVLPIHQSARPLDWGYGVSLPNAVENTYGTPDELRELVDSAHQHGIGVLIDVVHNHYSRDSVLNCYDGNCEGANGAYFYNDKYAMTPWGPRPDYTNSNVRDFIADNIDRYMGEYHVDGFRWDSTENIVEFRSPSLGENADGVGLIKQINQTIHQSPGALSFAEYWGAPKSATEPVVRNGLGFDACWKGFFPIVQAITASSPNDFYIGDIASALDGPADRVIFTESHDEVGHPPKQVRIPLRIDPADPGSLRAKKRSLLGAVLLMTAPGVPMLFQGQEFLESRTFEFPTGTPLDWQLETTNAGVWNAYRDLIRLRKNESGRTAALSSSNIEVFHQNERAKVLAFRRLDNRSNHQVVVLLNFSEKSFSSGYKVGLPASGKWTVAFSSDDQKYSADFSGSPRVRAFTAGDEPYNGFDHSTTIELAPFTAVILTN